MYSVKIKSFDGKEESFEYIELDNASKFFLKNLRDSVQRLELHEILNVDSDRLILGCWRMTKNNNFTIKLYFNMF